MHRSVGILKTWFVPTRPNSWTKSTDKSLKRFPPCYPQVTANYLFKLTQPLTVPTVQLLYSIETIPPSHGLRNPYRNLKSENSEDYALNEIVRS
jgi:hypothetical protein